MIEFFRINIGKDLQLQYTSSIIYILVNYLYAVFYYYVFMYHMYVYYVY